MLPGEPCSTPKRMKSLVQRGSIWLQKGIVGLPCAHPADEIVGRAARLASAFRGRGLPVVLVNVAGRAPGRTEVQFNFTPPADWQELVPSSTASRATTR